MQVRISTIALPLILLFISSLASAENSTQADGYTIHHNAIPTALLAPEVASNYRIVRSKYRGLLNVSVIRDIPGTTGQPVTAKVTAYALNLIGRRHNIELREIREGDAIYYIGDFPIVDGETLKFTLEVTPEGATRSITASLSQDFYID
ncbi:DUF4426 domain-containing protein [Sedimenticola thiotaurini]|uniref:Orotate phosphoribosyltransferase n=1 Tax=Sedimenticola thiotaurini TaxID=1543721 RepID=A0A0F7K0C6_9GAMM|nr:DUF4426 domain-containing protein [Sedimenticola thiotaurini]AKH20605.1 orotate phosphoribosyltransferase [Sedimenticola thiotaurini]